MTYQESEAVELKAVVFDIGGTFVKYGVYEGGLLKEVSSLPTQGEAGADALISRLLKICRSITDANAIGICTRGQVNCDTGRIIYDLPHIIPGYAGKNLKKEFGIFGIPVAVENDANCMAIAESAAISADNTADILCLTYGTCVGGAIVRDGKIYHGANWSAGEFGMMYLRGEYYENVASVTRLVERAKSIDKALCDGRAIAKEMHRREVFELLDDWAASVAEGIASLIHIFNPCCVIIGGGLMENDEIFSLVASKVGDLTAPGFDVEIRKAKYGNSAGLIGAGMLAETA